MKVIKQLKRQTTQEKLNKFFREMPIISKAILILYSLMALILMLASTSDQFSLWSLFKMRFSQLLLFIIIGLSDLKRQQGKGSFYLIISFIMKNCVVLFSHLILILLIDDWPTFSIFTKTSLIIEYLFIIMVEDALKSSDEIKYLFIEPFQIKSKFYPLFFFLILSIGGLRIDLLVPLIFAILIHFIKCNDLMTKISIFFDEKLYGQKLQKIGFVKTGGLTRIVKTMDQITTNDSIMIQEK